MHALLENALCCHTTVLTAVPLRASRPHRMRFARRTRVNNSPAPARLPRARPLHRYMILCTWSVPLAMTL